MKRPTLSFLFALCALALGSSACQSPLRSPGADDAMMASLSASQRATIDQARANYNLRTDELAVARLDVVRSKAELSLAKTDLEIARANVTRAENVVSVAQTSTAADLEAARNALEVTSTKVPQQDLLVLWRGCSVTRSERALDVAQCSQALAYANTELEKARAYSVSDRAASRNVDVRAHEERVSGCQTKESVARAKLAGAVRECEMAERSYEGGLTTASKG